jgi:GT2 family glycosyltransferase
MRDSVRQVDIITGCFLLIDRKMWDKLGGFDEAFFMYGEEADLCLRAQTFGARPLMTPDAAIMHVGGASERIHVDKMVRLLKGKMTVVRRHFDPWRRPIAVGLFIAWPWSRAVFTTLLGSTKSAWPEIWARRGEWRPGYGPKS